MTSERLLSAPRRRRAYWHAALTLVVLTAVVCLARRHWPVLETGAVRLAVADQGWLLVAALATLATAPCAALALQGAVPRRLPPGRLVAGQFAASTANHFLPAGLGGCAVTLRLLMRCGIPIADAATAIVVKGTAGALVRGALVAVLFAACPGRPHLPNLPHFSGELLLTVCVLAGGAMVVSAGPLRRWCRRALVAVRAYVGVVHARPARAAGLWGGSLAFVALHCLVLITVTRAVALPLPPARVALLYVAASTVAALLPTPGGLGSFDAVLALALTAAGAPATAAASAVLGYRLLTVWLPLLPGLVVLGVLVRRGAL
ncbi:membrane protein [Streptomyces viridochromogenes]|uniref:Membrane protein n=1 Tax=Streptomyces viridochromogenes TaxID=1938 RepID=A0A0J8CGJ8_STRVR|nr:lysylphosphatidylglycerol synthase transmembrane domain-containing protein [Streptomyces viridochromogenes]KMS77115.1 membrane protein [Streptomyces viridochromogenes]KOG09358.1 membrane protein [Streptomyces viridochromogenes]KOG27265.1 membrane protein [Streptomyces viridochromogenes]